MMKYTYLNFMTKQKLTYRSYGAQQPLFVRELLTWRASGT